MQFYEAPGPGIWELPGALLTPELDGLPCVLPGPPGVLWVPPDPEPGPPEDALPEEDGGVELFCPG